MIIQAIRYTLADSDEAFDAVLKTTLIGMLGLMLRDTELENRRLALTTLNSAAHNKPDLIIPNLGLLLPLVDPRGHYGPIQAQDRRRSRSPKGENSPFRSSPHQY
jgi:hypothetical protein